MKIINFKKIDSTNNKAKEILSDKTVVVASLQTGGKGRFKRKWSSSLGGLYFSIILKVKDVSKIKYFTFIAAISVFKAVKDYGVETVIKWPNDLLYNGGKICGILTEGKFGKEKYAIVGIGVNTNNKIPLSLKGLSLCNILHKKVDNKKLLDKILYYFEKNLKLNKAKIVSEWKKNSFLGTKVKVNTIDGKYEGIAYDVDKDLNLILKVKDKKIKIREGDVGID